MEPVQTEAILHNSLIEPQVLVGLPIPLAVTFGILLGAVGLITKNLLVTALFASIYYPLWKLGRHDPIIFKTLFRRLRYGLGGFYQ